MQEQNKSNNNIYTTSNEAMYAFVQSHSEA